MYGCQMVRTYGIIKTTWSLLTGTSEGQMTRKKPIMCEIIMISLIEKEIKTALWHHFGSHF